MRIAVAELLRVGLAVDDSAIVELARRLIARAVARTLPCADLMQVWVQAGLQMGGGLLCCDSAELHPEAQSTPVVRSSSFPQLTARHQTRPLDSLTCLNEQVVMIELRASE